MANNLIQIKRTSVSGRAANTTTLPNPGELAINITDGIMYSTNGSVVFEVGANNTNSQVSGTLTVNSVSANGSLGAEGQVLTSNGTTVYWSAVSTGSLSNRNRVINGNFDIWQRGTSGSSGYVADRWATILNGSTAAITQQAFTLGQTDVPNDPSYFHRVAVTSVAGASNYALLYQPIEYVRTFAGQTCTLSFWAKADASKNIAVEFVQGFGAGGSPSSTVLGIGVTTCSLTTSWQKFTVTATLPSISGKTLGTSGTDQLILIFWLDAGSDYNARTNSLGQQSGTFDIAQVQLEAGDTATPFEHRLYGQELALCQRYFYRWGYTDATGGIGTIPIQAYGAAGSGIDIWQNHPVEMRASPTISISGTWVTYGITTFYGRFQNRQGFSVRYEMPSTGPAYIYANSVDDYFDLSAEL